MNYCQSQGWQVVDVFQDDGYTGLNTDRPDLQRLLKACEKGLVNLVITKDQSRLGRNHVQTGFLMEEFFPKHGVRYIALYDNVDTSAGDNEIAPFKNVLNEMYSRGIFPKVMRPITSQSRESLQALFLHWDIRKPGGKGTSPD